jgi:hypothetical protein
MDWYYPVLGGVITARRAACAIDLEWDRFVVPDLGIRCVADRPWVTGAETCELALALTALGELDRAAEQVAAMQHLRHDDGSYWTGYVYPDDARWPVERSTWTSAAVLLAADAIDGAGPTREAFRPVRAACGTRSAASSAPTRGPGRVRREPGPHRPALPATRWRTRSDPVADAPRSRRSPAPAGRCCRAADRRRRGPRTRRGSPAARRGDVGAPALVVALRGLLGVAAVDEHHAHGQRPDAAAVEGRHHGDHVLLEAGVRQASVRKVGRVSKRPRPGPPSQGRGTLAGLVLLGAAMVVDGDRERALAAVASASSSVERPQ